MTVTTIIRAPKTVAPTLPEFEVLTYSIPADGTTTAAIKFRTSDPSVDFWVNGKLVPVPTVNGVAQLEVGSDAPQQLVVQVRSYSTVINAGVTPS